MLMRKAAAALAAGCTMIAKPAEDTPLSALAIAALAEESGVPAGVFNVTPASDPAGVGLELTTNPAVRKLSFTGSTEVGRLLLAQSASTVKKVSMELGGNVPFIVFDDADIDAAVKGAIASKYRNAGQTCVCANRIFVHRSVHDRFCEKLAGQVAALRVGPGEVRDNEIGPLINRAALEKVEKLLAGALKAGATVIEGGKRHAAGDLFFEPTVITGVLPDMLITQTEIFGPVAAVMTFDDEDEAVTMANDTPFGLAAYLYTKDLGRAFRVGEALEYGMVGVNEGAISAVSAPFGGVKQSGIGREGSKYGIEDYLETKYLCMGGAIAMSNTLSKTDAPTNTTNAAWQARKDAAMARGEGAVAPVFVDRARGSEIWDVEGKRYIDFATGIAVCNTGHMHPSVHAAVTAQLERFSHTCVMVTPYDSAVMLAERINELAPGASRKKTMFVTTGAEAVENAVKIARSHTGRRGVISFNGGYHGRTNLTMSLTGKVTPYKNRFGPFAGEVYRAPFPIPYHGVSVEASLRAIEMLFTTDIDPSDCAAILLEPVQGEGGFYPAPDAFLQALRRICDEHGIVLVVDEIQSGFARTGRFFACEYAGVEPDLMTFAKGIAGGFPLAGVVGKQEIMDAPAPGGLGGTYAGSPVGCAAALAVIDVINEEGLVERACEIGAVFKERLTGLHARYPALIGDVRADRGAMIALELVRDGVADKPNPELAKILLAECYKRGLVVLTCGVRGNVFRFLPALTISDDLIQEGFAIFAGALNDLA